MLQDIKHIGQIAVEIHIEQNMKSYIVFVLYWYIYYTITLRHQISVISSNGGSAKTDVLIFEKESLLVALIVIFII